MVESAIFLERNVKKSSERKDTKSDGFSAVNVKHFEHDIEKS